MEKYYSLMNTESGKAQKSICFFNFTLSYSRIWNSGLKFSEGAGSVELHRFFLIYKHMKK
jgi:hypothetical protein